MLSADALDGACLIWPQCRELHIGLQLKCSNVASHIGAACDHFAVLKDNYRRNM